jgi:hypothetical protein
MVPATLLQLLMSMFGLSETEISQQAKITAEGLSEQMIGNALVMQLKIIG